MGGIVHLCFIGWLFYITFGGYRPCFETVDGRSLQEVRCALWIRSKQFYNGFRVYLNVCSNRLALARISRERGRELWVERHLTLHCFLGLIPGCGE